MRNGSGVAPSDRYADGRDGGDGSKIAENIILGVLVDTVTTASAEMGVDMNGGEPKRPFSLCRITHLARGAESHSVCPCIPALTCAALVLSRR